MARELLSAKSTRAQQLLDRLEAQFPNAGMALGYQTPIQLLVAVILSAQCTDERVNRVTPTLFRRFPDVEAFAAAAPEDIEPWIRTCGLFRAKARGIVAASRALLERHAGEVPRSREALEALPGVGRKTAGVVCIHLDGDAALPVDTHILRLSRRLGLCNEKHPDQVERALRKLLPQERWTRAHHLLIGHGRKSCRARAPACATCPVADLCPKIGVKEP